MANNDVVDLSSLTTRNFSGPKGKSSLRLEAAMWDGLAEVCHREGWTLAEAIAVARATYRDRRPTSALRTYLIHYFRQAATEAGHLEVGHGSV